MNTTASLLDKLRAQYEAVHEPTRTATRSIISR